MIKVIGLDLDDTLISKRNYDMECFKSVAMSISKKINSTPSTIFISLMKEYDELNRVSPIDIVLKKNNCYSKEYLDELICLYQSTIVKNCIFNDVIPFLLHAKALGYLIVLITDGKVNSQQKKISNVNLNSFFSHIIYTYQFGEDKKKPDLYPFEYIIRLLDIEYSQMIYVGDNPYRDFVNINQKGVLTVRIFRDNGQFVQVRLPEPYEAKYCISSLFEIFDIISRDVIGKE